MRVILFLLGKSRLALFVAGVTGFVSGLASAGLIALIGQALSGGVRSDSWLLLAFVLLAIVTLAMRVFSQFVLIRIAHRAFRELRMELCDRILSTPLATLERIGPARLVAMLTDDVQAVFDGVQVVPYLLVHAVTVGGCLLYLGWLSPLGLALIVFFLGIGAVVYAVFNRGAVREITRARMLQDKVFDHFRGVVEGTKELQLHRGKREDYLRGSLADVSEAYHHHAIRGMNLYTVAGTWAQLLVVAVLGLFVFKFTSWGVTTSGNLAAFGLTLLYMARPLDFVVQMVPALGRARVALEKVESMELTLGGSAPSIDPLAPKLTWHQLELNGLGYSYITESEDDRFHVGPIDLTFQPGEVVFLIGANGSGKSTLAKLILGLYAPETGTIRLDGRAIDDSSREWYRQHFSAIFVDFHLFARLHGLEGGRDRDAVAEYLDRLHLAHKVRVNDLTLETAGLSQGQRKRLALLGAYLEDRPIYLFDEWAADQDPHFRDVFYTKLLKELKERGKLVLVVSHDERYYSVADRVVKLEAGKIISITSPQSAPAS